MRYFAPALLLILALRAPASAQTPAVNTVTPSAVAPGQTTELTLLGAALELPTELWTSFRSEADFAPGSGDRAVCRITVPSDVPVGIAAVRVATRGGVSNLHLYMVDDLPTVPGRTGIASAASAQEVAPPVAIDGTSDALGFDFYRFHAKRGQRVSVEVVAARLGSALDPVLRLLDISGRELAWADDSVGAGGDCRFAHTFAADGDYLVELRDAHYEGGPAFRYRLRIGDFPLAVVPFPLGGKRGTAGLFTLIGDGCDGVPPVLVGLAMTSRGAPVAGRQAADGGSGFATVVAGDLDETIEAEPNDGRAVATPLALPVAVSGRLEAAGDVDFYKLAARKGDRVSFRARTRSLGSPCDLIMRLLRGDGKTVAESKVEGPEDARFEATIPEEGTYWLHVAEITGAGGPSLAYRIEISPRRDGFQLGVETDKVDAKPGGTFEIKVTAVRRDYGGAITLSLDGLAAAALEGATIPAGKQEATLKVTLRPDHEPGKIVHFRILGSATTDGGGFRAAASTSSALRKLFPRILHPPAELDGIVALGVRGDGR